MLGSINLNQLRVFESVFRLGSMTEAARTLHLTQSGVSQHIQSLEGVLGVRLFDRVRQRLVPTRAAHQLYARCTRAFSELESGLFEAKGEAVGLRGLVSIGTPVEFGNNVLMGELADFGRANPGVNFNLRYGFFNEMNAAVLKGELDFAFVDDFGGDKRLAVEPVYDEVLVLCASKEFVEARGPYAPTHEYFEALDYVDYQPEEPVLRGWFRHHFGERELKIHARCNVMDVQGVAVVILHGLAAGVLPEHLVAKLERDGAPIHRFEPENDPLVNVISLAYLKERTQTPAAAATLQWLKQATRRWRTSATIEKSAVPDSDDSRFATGLLIAPSGKPNGQAVEV